MTTPSWMSNTDSYDKYGSYYDDANKTWYTPTYNQAFSGGGENGEWTNTVNGYRGYADQGLGKGVFGDAPSIYNGSQYTNYDAQGNSLGTTGTWSGLSNATSGGDFVQAVAMMLPAFGAAISPAANAAMSFGSNPVTGAAGGGAAGGLESAVGNTAQQGFRTGEIAGQGAYSGGATGADLDAFYGGTDGGASLGGGASSTGGLGAGANTNPVFNPAQDSQLASNNITAAGGDPFTPLGSGAAGTGVYGSPSNVLAPPNQTTTGGAPGGTTTGGAPGGGTTTGGNTTGSGLNLGDLMKLFGGISDRNNQNNASQQMLDYLKQRQGINDNMYAPGSTEANALWDEMSRKDAAAGRNSQYGPRSVDLGARIAQLKMDANTKMTTGIGSLYQNAINQNASSDAGLWSSLGNLFGNGTGGTSNLNLGSLMNLIGGGSSSTGTTTTGGGTGFGTGSNFGNEDYGQYF